MKKWISLFISICLMLTSCALVSDVKTLSGDNLVVALSLLPEDFESMSTQRKTAYTVACLELEIMNGGLCQFFANNPECSAYVPEALSNLGAEAHLELYAGFLTDHNIDPLAPVFQTEDMEEFSRLYDLFPWEEFEEAYCALTPMAELLETYVRTNPDSF